MTHVAILGDSIAGSVGPPDRWGDVMAERLGWTTDIAGWGGMGYVDIGTDLAGPFINRVAADIVAHSPDVVMVQGGLNDDSLAVGVLQTAVALVLTTIRASLPTKPIYIFAPYGPTTADPLRAQLLARGAEMLVATYGFTGVTYVDTLTDPWITGTGNTGAPVGDGNADLYIGPDGTHPNAAGQEYYGVRLAGLISPLAAFVGAFTAQLGIGYSAPGNLALGLPQVDGGGTGGPGPAAGVTISHASVPAGRAFSPRPAR